MDIMSFLNSGVLRALGVAAIGLLALIAHQFFGQDAAIFTGSATQLLDAGLAVLTAAALAWAAYARAKLPNPPLTQAAAAAHVDILAAQGQTIVPTATVTPPAPASSSSVAKSHWTAALFALVVVGMMLMSACATEPVNAAVTPGQKAAALLGDFNIYEAASVSIGTNTALPMNVRKGVLQAAIMAKPAADSVQAALMTYRQVTTALAAGATTQDQVDIAATNLTNWVAQLTTLVTNLIAAEKGATTP